MEPQPNPSRRTIFGPFEFEAKTGELRKHGIRLRLTGQPLRILEVLLARPNEVVGREELQQLLWSGTTFVDFEHGLNAAINKLRQTLGDSADQPRWVETLPGRGYRFIGALRHAHSGLVLEMTPTPVTQEKAQDAAVDQAQPVQRGFFNSTRLALAGLAVVAVAGFTVTRFVRQPLPNSASPLVRFRIQIPAGLKLSESQSFSVSPDGRTMVYLATGSDGRQRLWAQALDSLEPRMLPGTEASVDAGAIWSPDSKFVAFYADGKLKSTDLTGGPPHLIAKVPSTVLGGDWSRDGIIIFGTETPGVMRVDANGGEAVAVTMRDPARGDRVHGWPSFLPDGRHFLYLHLSSTAENIGIFAGSIDVKPGEQSLKRLAATTYGAKFVPSPDGNGVVLFQRENTLFAQNFNVSLLDFAGEIRKLGENVGSTRAYGYFAGSPNVLIHRSGRGGVGQFTWFDRDGKRLGKVGQQHQFDSAPDISRDGSRIAESNFSEDHVNVWVHDILRDVSQRITLRSQNKNPIWSPDGSKIVFSSGWAGQYDLYQIDAAGGKEKLLYKSGNSKRASSWSADGRYLLYSTQAEKYGIELLPMDGAGLPIALTTGRFNQLDGVFSPDAKWIAHVSDESGTSEVYLQPFSDAPGSLENGPKTLISRGGGTRPRWRADGSELFYRASNGMVMSVTLSASPLQPSIPKSLFLMEGTRWDVTPDGKRFLIGVPAEEAPQPFTVVLNWQNEGKQ